MHKIITKNARRYHKRIAKLMKNSLTIVLHRIDSNHPVHHINVYYNN